MTALVRTDSHNRDFVELVKLLDADLAVRDGDEHAFYSQFNKIDDIRFVVLVYEDEQPVGCGAIKHFSDATMEIKRMFVLPAARNKGVATKLLSELEQWAVERSCRKCVLETGIKQPEAIALYKKSGYHAIENYGQYAGVANSMCFEKLLPT